MQNCLGDDFTFGLWSPCSGSWRGEWGLTVWPGGPCVRAPAAQDGVASLTRRVCPGEDADLCSELLQESLDALRALPEASLFDESTVSSVWLEVVERATRFLRSVVTG